MVLMTAVQSYLSTHECWYCHHCFVCCAVGRSVAVELCSSVDTLAHLQANVTLFVTGIYR